MSDRNDAPWPTWIAKHNHRVLLSILGMGLPLSEAECIVHTTWERLMRQHSEGSLIEIEMPGLAIRQARFLALDYLRREHPKRLAEHSLDDHNLTANHADSDPQRALLARQRMERVSDGLAECSPKAREVFRLFYIDGLTATDIGTRVELSAQRVRQTLCEVRSTLRDAIGET